MSLITDSIVKRIPQLAPIIAWISILQIPGTISRSYEILENFFKVLIKLSDWYQDLLAVLNYCRFSILVLLLGIAMLFHPQGQELAMRLDSEPLHAAFFLFGLVLWSFQAWYGARRLLYARFGTRKKIDKASDKNEQISRFLLPPGSWEERFVRFLVPTFHQCLEQTPRVVGLAAYVFALSALLIAQWKKGTGFTPIGTALCVLVVLLAIGFYWLLLKRRNLMLKLPGFKPNVRDEEGLTQLHRHVVPFTFAYSITFTLLAIYLPVWFGFHAGSLGVMLLGFSSIIPVGSWLVYQTSRKPAQPDYDSQSHGARNFPVITVLLLAAMGFSFFNDNHAVRTSDSPPTQLELNAALDNWKAQAKEDSSGVKPLIIVATAGGGIRAAHWTAVVLGGLSDIEPNFRRDLFAISGVSGGSVGAAFYAAALNEGSTNCAETRYPQRGNTCFEGQSLTALSRDFLAPSLARMLYPDLMQRFVFAPIFPDRQRALEYGWEQSWLATYRSNKTRGLATPFTQIAQTRGDGAWVPYLLLNSAHLETGKRIVASPVKLDAKKFSDTLDLLDMMGQDIPLSTAAGNSARFPYVSPAGTLRCDPERFEQTQCGHILDGGYFENYGAITAKQMLSAITETIDRKTIRPVIIVISSDPKLGRNETLERDDPAREVIKGKHDSGANESLGPPKGLLSPRVGRGVLAAKELRDGVNQCAVDTKHCDFGAEPKFFHFRMDVPEGQKEPALGWLLSIESEKEIARMLTCGGADSHNLKVYRNLLELLGTDAAQIQRGIDSCNTAAR